MQRDFTFRKQAILVGLAVLLSADVALAVYAWRTSSSSESPQLILAKQTRQLELLRADVKRAQDIRDKIPEIRKGFDQFVAGMPPLSKASSSETTEMDSIAAKSNVKLDDVRFHQKDDSKQGFSEVEVEATVTGEYGAVVHFLNGLQRSNNVYAVDSLALASDSQNQGPAGPLRVNLRMKTYFRAA